MKRTPKAQRTRSQAARSSFPRGNRYGPLWLTGTCTSLLVLLFGTPPSLSQEAPELWGTDGNVVATARLGNTLYIAGAFNAVGPVTGGGVPVHAETGDPIAGYPRVAGLVRTAIPDGEGGWYIGGTFSAAGGVPCANLAHILKDGQIAHWSPTPDGEVLALVLEGETLYVGGEFHYVGGESRDYVAAIDVKTGVVTEFDPQPDQRVRALHFEAGRLFVGGDFSNIGGQARHSLADVDPMTGLATPWNPDVSFYGNPARVHALATQGDTLYIGGAFWNVGSNQRRNVAAVHAVTGLATDWNPTVTGPDDIFYGDPYVATLVARDQTILVGGRFTGIGGQARGGLAEVDRLTGLVTSWNPEPGPWFGNVAGDVYTLALRESTVCVAGSFYSLGGQPRNYVGEVDLITGLATEWNPNANKFGVFSLSVSGNSIYVGGTFTGIGRGWLGRRGLAALDATTGVVKGWDPSPDGLIINSLAVAENRIYVGGHFSWVGGHERWGLAALDTLTGQATQWNPVANGVVASLEVSGDTLFVGGDFTTMGGVPRNHLASFDLQTGNLTDWNPDANNVVDDLSVRENTVYVCGFFGAIGGVSRRGIAAIDARTGTVTSWDPSADGSSVNAIALYKSTILAAGPFESIGGQPRKGVAALDATTGDATEWIADINSRAVYALATIGDTLFVGGEYTSIGGQERHSVAAVDAATGTVLPWNPDLGAESYGWANPVVWSLAANGNTLYVGGAFTRISDTPSSSITAISFAPISPPPSPMPSRLTMAPIRPNPVHANLMATIRFALPEMGPVSVSVFDVQGRRVTQLLNHEVRSAGTHDVHLNTKPLPAGFYFCQVETRGQKAAQKLVILK